MVVGTLVNDQSGAVAVVQRVGQLGRALVGPLGVDRRFLPPELLHQVQALDAVRLEPSSLLLLQRLLAGDLAAGVDVEIKL